jgi:hypothetical protein
MFMLLNVAADAFRAGAALVLLAGVLAAGGRDASAALIVASTCDDTCVNGKTTDANQCVTSATGKCVPSATAPKGSACIGCGFEPITDTTGKVIGCTHTCTALTTT